MNLLTLLETDIWKQVVICKGWEILDYWFGTSPPPEINTLWDKCLEKDLIIRIPYIDINTDKYLEKDLIIRIPYIDINTVHTKMKGQLINDESCSSPWWGSNTNNMRLLRSYKFLQSWNFLLLWNNIKDAAVNETITWCFVLT